MTDGLGLVLPGEAGLLLTRLIRSPSPEAVDSTVR